MAEDHGVCIRPLAMRRLDTSTGRVDVVPIPCGATDEAKCRPCADKARRLRMVQCRQGWHLEHEPIGNPAEPSERHKQLLAIRADLHTRYTLAKEIGDEQACDEIRDAVDELDADIRGAGVRGRLAPLDPEPARARRSTRRR